MSKSVQQRVRAHDRYQVEFKLDYELLPNQQTRYKITTYTFTPRSLDINRSSYAKAEFYRDLQNYVRLKTPSFELSDLLIFPTSPLLHIGEILRQPHWADDPMNVERLINSFKFLRAIMKSSLRRHLHRMKMNEQGRAHDGDEAPPVNEAVDELLAETSAIVQCYREYEPYLQQSDVDERVLRSYRLTDESISLLWEERLIDAFQFVDKFVQGDLQTDLQKRLSQQVQAEVCHRKAAHYHSLLQPEGDNEAFVFRTSVLKKFTSSVLYLSLAIKREGTAIEQFLYALAAGLSMVFATLIAFYFQVQFGNFSFPMFTALVVGYMFKDRIKELGRLFFLRYLQNFLYDRRTIIRTRDGAYELGFLREKMDFISEQAVPSTVKALRNRGLITEVDNDGQEENVICYTKEVVLQTAAFSHIYTGGPPITGVNDIMRFDVRPYLRKMDDPMERRLYLEDGQLREVNCDKVYYINFVTAYTVGEAQEFIKLERTLLTLTRDGIKRVTRIRTKNR
jgi:hypothetical protein